jgi:ferredoxin-NADP reductase
VFTQLLRTVDVARPTGSRRGLPSPRSVARSVVASPLLDALTAPHGVDRYLELVRPTFSLRELRAEVVHVRRQTTDSVTLRLRPNRQWRGFAAGQSLAVTVEIDGVRRTRSYSLANSQHAADGCLELTVRAHPHGLVSRHLYDTARPGLVLALAPAAGDFVLPARRPDRLLLVSGGSGITPVLSMLRTLCDEDRVPAVTFLHYARDERSAPYRAELAALVQRHPNVRVVHVYTEGRRRRHFSRAQLNRLAPDALGAPAYVCGPPALVQAVRRVWTREGAAERVFHESFLPVRVQPVPGDASGTVSFHATGTSVASSGVTLLEQAEAAGLRPLHGCRMGICHTCTCRKLAGQVRNVHTGELSSAEPEDIQICVSVPAGDVQLDL